LSDNDYNYKKIDHEFRDLRKDKASVDWVKAKCEPIDRSIVDLWAAVNEAKVHKCKKEDQLKALEQMPGMQRDLGSWKFFRNLFIGVIGTILIVVISAIVAFANVQADTERTKEDLKEQKRNYVSFKHDLNQIKTQGTVQRQQKADLEEIKTSLKSLVKIQEAAAKEKKKKRKR